jgi:Protein of unknown function (DUF3987)
MEGQRQPTAPEPQTFNPGTDWINDFVELTRGISSPELFRKWVAIYTVGAALQRNIWAITNGRPLYPHLYTILVAPPGIGKSKILSKGREMLTALKPDVHVAYSSLTAASLIDNLNDAVRRHTRPDSIPAVVIDNSLAVVSSELGVLLPTYDPAFMNTLQDLYDCMPYSQKRRTRDIEIEIKNPQLSILAACTPAYLQGTLPEGAWAEGFTARCIFVFSGERILGEFFDESSEEPTANDALIARLKTINQLYGRLYFSDEAKAFINAWHTGGEPPAPDHPKLLHYCTRRVLNLAKLSMIASVSEGSNYIVEINHVERALEWLIEVEHYIPDIFKSMDNTSHSQILKDVWHYVFDTFRRENQRPVNESRILVFISSRVPAYAVKSTLDVLVNAGYLHRQIGKGGNEYVPRGKET